MEKEKERENKTDREKGREKDFTRLRPGVGSVRQRIQSAEGPSSSGLAHLGLQFVSFCHPCPSFRWALEFIRPVRCNFGQWPWGSLGSNFSFPADMAIV